MNSSDPPPDLILIGDVHLGRRPVKLDDALDGLSFSAKELTPAVALTCTVAAALKNPPRAVVFTGDLVDRDDDVLEAYSILKREIGLLAEAGICVYAIAGNHDGQILPKLIRNVAGVKLIGENGKWERVSVPGSSPPIDLFGWSFAHRSFDGCPLDHGDLSGVLRKNDRAGVVRIGVLHCDLDATNSIYAPVTRKRLEGEGLNAWFLGHVHAPSDLSSSSPIGYLGSIVGLDPGEVGLRGAWRVYANGSSVRAVQMNLGPIRWENLKVEISDKDSKDMYGIIDRLKDEFECRFASNETMEGGHYKLVVLRATLFGHLSDRTGPRRLSESCSGGQVSFDVGKTKVLVQRVEDRTRPRVNLDELAALPTPVGRIATQLVLLRDNQAEGLIKESEKVVAEIKNYRWDVDDDMHPLPVTRELIKRAAWRVLDSMLNQGEENADQ
jgi:DNA repair protein SbcD/Mre11